MTVRFRRRQGGWVRFWVPILPVALVFSPVLLLAAVGGTVACLVYRISPTRAFGVGWRLLYALGGTRIEIEQARMGLLLHFR
ncbi:hypothetical protein ABN034_28755 [Actinopolymorpha sp. B11F2]|uniref:hypothetical protein n=1 Tax=Actinopolymorpha sp. B11F2 TaxID=3160862 RepID=UPI0032E37F5A